MISILMPIYNGIEYIDDSVLSVLSQTYHQWELIIGINGHPENSDVYQIAKKYMSFTQQIQVYDFYKIKGKSNTLNEMLKYANYSHIAILDVDDIWYPSKLETQVKYINDYDVVGSLCVYFGEKTSLNGIVPSLPTENISDFDFCSVNPIINSSAIIRKECCYWNSEYDGVEDYDLWLNLRKHGKRFYNCADVYVKHRIHPFSAFNTKNNSQMAIQLLKKYRNANASSL